MRNYKENHEENHGKLWKIMENYGKLWKIMEINRTI